MIGIQNGSNGNRFESQLDGDPMRPVTASSLKDNPFVKVVVIIALSSTVFILLISGTATTAISYPPQPPKWQITLQENGELEQETVSVRTALDGDYKLLGPLLLMAGIFLLIVDVVLIWMVTRDVYYASRGIRPNMDISTGSVSVLGGPFFLAVPNAASGSHQDVTPFAFSRQLWAMPNAPTPDFSLDGLKGSTIRPLTATLTKCSQPPFNPEVEPKKPSDNL